MKKDMDLVVTVIGKHQDRPNPRIGRSFIFFREGHKWHGCGVSVIGKKGTRWIVARSGAVVGALMSPRGSKKRQLKTWTCTDAELW